MFRNKIHAWKHVLTSVWHQKRRQLTTWLTSEEMVLQAALGHVLVQQQELLVLPAVPQQPHLGLHITVITNYIISRKNQRELGLKM
jgi:hypothetical protein